MYGRGTQLGFGPPITPTIIKQLLIANLAVFVLQQLMPGIEPFGAVRPIMVWQGGYLWQPFTYMWLHGGLAHLAMNCFALWMFGSPLALAWGARRFMRFYLVCGVGAGFIIATYPYVGVALKLQSPMTLGYFTLGASGAIYGVLLAYSLTWPDRTIMLIFPPIAFRAIWLIPALFLFQLMDPRSNISHLGHLGGVLVGWLYLRRTGAAGSPLTLKHLQHRWRRYRMRQKLRAVRWEERQQRRRRDDDHTLH